MITFALKHGRSLDEAKGQLEQVVNEAGSRFGMMMNRVEWAAGRDRVLMAGPGFEVRMWVDAENFHLSGDIPVLSALLRGPLEQGLKDLAEKHFQRRLT